MEKNTHVHKFTCLESESIVITTQAVTAIFKPQLEQVILEKSAFCRTGLSEKLAKGVWQGNTEI